MNEYDAENRLSRAVITMPEPEPLPGDVAEPESGAAIGQASEVAETDGTASGNRIKTITQENLYNGDGQRVRKSEGAKETYYFYQDGVVSYTVEGKKETKAVQNLLGLEGNVILAERAVEISGEPTSEGGTSGEKAEDGAASEETKNRKFDYYLYNKDVQGSTTSILDEDGAGELSYEYDDFGETEINGNSVFRNEICYTGGIYDETTGLYYLNARYYDPESGRFLTEDTYRGELKEPDTLHLYVYCKNNPINYVDPSGHSPVSSKLSLADYYVIHKCVQIVYMFRLMKKGRGGDMEVTVRNAKTGKVCGYLDVYDVIKNNYYEVKSKRQCDTNRSAVEKQMQKYDKSIITMYSKKKKIIKNIKRGTDQFSGSFYYGAWKIQYGYKRKGLVYYSPKLDKAKQKRLKKAGETVKKVGMGIVTVGFYIGSRGAMPVVRPI